MRTFRRTLLDDALAERLPLFTGRVLDVGGKKVRKRGLFRPDAAPAESWEYLNVDAETQPDILAPADAIPAADESYDSIMLAEVLQHLEEPGRVLREIGRVMRPGGVIVATIPFLFPVHHDPDDFQRWPPTLLRIEFERAGLHVDELVPMGSVAAVIFDLLWVTWGTYTARVPRLPYRLASAPFVLVKPLVAALDRRLGRVRDRINTGYLVVARKPASNSPSTTS
jgi:SAM-dependent methyltransferase